MKNEHLTEETLQAYLLEELANDAIGEHLAACSACKTKLENYRYLIANVRKIEHQPFSFDVTTVAMTKILHYERQVKRKKELFFWGLLTFSIIVILALSVPFIPVILGVFHSKSIFITLLVLGTSLLVFLFLLADIRRQYKRREEKILKNNLQPRF